MKAGRSLFTATSAGFAAVLALHTATSPGRHVVTAPSKPTPSGQNTVPTGVRTALGADTQFGYGALSVKVTANGSRIIAVSVTNLQTAESYSQSLASQAIPILTSEALSAQSANIQGVSGASYTSAGFAQSLQSALSQLGI